MSGTLAERHLIGSLLLEPNGFKFAGDSASADDFSDQRMGAIYAGMQKMRTQKVPINAISVGNQFGAWKIRGITDTDLLNWSSDVPNAFRAGEFAEAVRDAAVRRGLADIARRYGEAALDPAWIAPDAVSRAVDELNALRANATAKTFIARKLADVLAESDDYDWIIPGLLERRDRLILTGGEGAGKTTFVRQLAILSAAGIHPLNGTKIAPVRVLVVDAENTERQWRRAVRWLVREAADRGVADPGEVVHLMAGNRIDITREKDLGEIHRLIDEHKPDVLFIGPLYKLVPKAITNDDDATPLIVALDSLRERNVALVMEAHAGKGTGQDGDRDLRPRGSSALLGWPEFGFGLQVVDPGGPQQQGLTVKFGRWRGDREQRDWPKHMRRGAVGEWPWMPTLFDS